MHSSVLDRTKGLHFEKFSKRGQKENSILLIFDINRLYCFVCLFFKYQYLTLVFSSRDYLSWPHFTTYSGEMNNVTKRPFAVAPRQSKRLIIYSSSQMFVSANSQAASPTSSKQNN